MLCSISGGRRRWLSNGPPGASAHHEEGQRDDDEQRRDRAQKTLDRIGEHVPSIPWRPPDDGSNMTFRAAMSMRGGRHAIYVSIVASRETSRKRPTRRRQAQIGHQRLEGTRRDKIIRIGDCGREEAVALETRHAGADCGVCCLQRRRAL